MKTNSELLTVVLESLYEKIETLHDNQQFILEVLEKAGLISRKEK